VRARLRTVGVEEHQFIMNDDTFTPGSNHPVYVYDVGGARSNVSPSASKVESPINSRISDLIGCPTLMMVKFSSDVMYLVV
jgi:hypothetical protein